MQCPKCGSSEIEQRNHEQNLQKIGGVLLSGAGATAGTVGGAGAITSGICHENRTPCNVDYCG